MTTSEFSLIFNEDTDTCLELKVPLRLSVCTIIKPTADKDFEFAYHGVCPITGIQVYAGSREQLFQNYGSSVVESYETTIAKLTSSYVKQSLTSVDKFFLENATAYSIDMYEELCKEKEEELLKLLPEE